MSQPLQPLPEVGACIADKYRIDRLLGRGGSGAVFLAEHVVTGKRVALKWMALGADASPDDMERFVREARAAALISHPNVVNIYDVDEHEGALFLVMEYLRGAPLSQLLKAGPLPVGEAVATLLPAMEGVQAAHRAGVVHRDLKPDNIFLLQGPEGEPRGTKVLDFGIAKLSRQLEAGAPTTLTATGMVMGSPHYMAPEQAADASGVDHRADLYSLGVILYQALTGHPPFEAETLPGLLLKIAEGRFAPLGEVRPELPAALTRTVERCMALQPQDRFEDVAAAIRELTPFVQDGASTPQTGAPQSVLAEDGKSSALRRRAPAIAVAAVVLAVLGGIAGRLLSPVEATLRPEQELDQRPALPTATAAEPSEATEGRTGQTPPVLPKTTQAGPGPATHEVPAAPAPPAAPTEARSRGTPGGRRAVPTKTRRTGSRPAPAGSAAAGRDTERSTGEEPKGRLGVSLDPAEF